MIIECQPGSNTAQPFHPPRTPQPHQNTKPPAHPLFCSPNSTLITHNDSTVDGRCITNPNLINYSATEFLFTISTSGFKHPVMSSLPYCHLEEHANLAMMYCS
ncbi:Protein of unknown function [Pyronema omphalodes CBS 100304]|uniref:Uncharacterized protein n=1 Tax=Pyronema omphalodes (strain CBS 100304) TaxID=1076935 RepID=U4LCS2_PYROM|nr:Protein of unknown function [Pyronema omphalodes CBS 100304]